MKKTGTVKGFSILMALVVGVGSAYLLLKGFTKIFAYKEEGWWTDLLFGHHGFETTSMWIQLIVICLVPVLISIFLWIINDVGIFARFLVPIIGGFAISLVCYFALLIISLVISGSAYMVVGVVLGVILIAASLTPVAGIIIGIVNVR